MSADLFFTTLLKAGAVLFGFPILLYVVAAVYAAVTGKEDF